MRLVFDCEASGAQRNHAHPFDERNKLCNIGFKDIDSGEKRIFKIEYDDEPYGHHLKEIQQWLDKATLLIGFNAKYDLHWLSRYSLKLSQNCRIFDCQLAHFILTHQKVRYPSLDGVAEYYGVEKKLDVVKTEYWDRGLDTTDVPYYILEEYLTQDLEVTNQVYEKTIEDLSRQSYEMNQLVKMSNLDLVVLQDIEKNGLLINLEKSIKKGNELVHEMNSIDEWIVSLAGYDWFNPNSGDHLSAFLFGGTIKRTVKEDYVFTYKNGTTAVKQRNVEKPFTFKGLFKPLEGTELAKEGFYSTNEATLVTLSQSAKHEHLKVLETLLHRAKLEKRRGTYYHGYPKHIETFNWTDNIMHSSFNQCVVQTGRLSSTKPNVQNIEDQVKEIFISRFK